MYAPKIVENSLTIVRHFLDVFSNCPKHPTLIQRFLYATSGQCNMDDDM
jgi:hypothetical protein